MSTALARATYGLITEDLPKMLLGQGDLPAAYRQFRPVRESALDNHFMASHGFPGNTAASLRKIGRITGHVKEFGNPLAANALSIGTDVAIATVVHLFDDHDGVARWMSDIFIKQFVEHIGSEYDTSRKLLAAEPYEPQGFTDISAGMVAVEQGPIGTISSTIIDFRIGRVMGVAYVVALGKVERKTVVREVALSLEKRIVRVTLGAA
ncbi:MAG: hypothetical protein FJ039_10405 [Chloroflexi bacterium]|nr:hypothetical protein [Chloroflexota bacterium]